MGAGSHRPGRWWRPLLVALLLVPACEWPRDAGGTLDRVRGGTLRAGVTEAQPWVVLGDGSPAGVEVRLVEGLAEELDADILWVVGSESELMEALHVRALDIVVGGLTASAPWADHASLSRSYATTRTVIAVPEGTPTGAGFAGREVAVEPGSADVERVRAEDAVPLPVEDVTSATGPVVVDDWRLDDLGLLDSGVDVTTHEHVVAVPLGESGWQVTVERYLLDVEPARLDRLLDEEAR